MRAAPWTLLLPVMSLVQPAAAQVPLGAAWTYQGELRSAGVPVVTDADLRFSLFDAADAGTQIGQTLELDAVALDEGRFSVELDFGPASLSGEARWLEIAVRNPAGLGEFTALQQRQPITGVPYALQSRGMFVQPDGDVGIGTTDPLHRLHVKSPSLSGLFESDSIGSTWIGISNTSSESHWNFLVTGQVASVGPGKLLVGFGSNSGEHNTAVTLANRDGRGLLGVGTTDPFGTFHVRHPRITQTDPWPILLQNEDAQPVTGMSVSNDGFFNITSQIGGPGFARLSPDGAWTAISDRRVKRNITPMRNVLDTAMALEPVGFQYAGGQGENVGFVAQDVEPLFPSLVAEADGLLSLNYSGMSVVAIAALQDLKHEKDAEIDALRRENEDLEARLRRLEARLQTLAGKPSGN